MPSLPGTGYEVLAWTRYRKAAVRRLLAAAQIPQFSVVADLNVDALMELKAATKVSLTSLLVKAISDTLVSHPRIRAYLQDDELRVPNAINIGVAVATDQGLVVPVVHAANLMDPDQIQARIQELRSRAEAGTLAMADITEGCITLSNLGMFGIRQFTALLNPPQSAILAAGAVTNTDGGRMLALTLTADHRVIDGADAARFLEGLQHSIEQLAHSE